MRRRDDSAVRIWMFSAAAFFALVIAYFLWAKVSGRPSPAGPRPRPDTAPVAEPTASTLPTAPIRMKIKRIEARKYRREGQLPPPPSVR